MGQWEGVCIAVTLPAPMIVSSRCCELLHIMNPAEITHLIEAAFSDAVVKVESNDNTHYVALVVAAEFEGKRRIARHQMVYKSLGALVGNEIHALSITTLTPDEWRQQSGES